MAKLKLKQLDRFPDYYAGNDGNIYSTRISPRYNPTGDLRMVKPRIHPTGYVYYGLFVGKGGNKNRIWTRGHRLIVEAWMGEIPKKMEVNHKDLVKTNNNPKNLEIVTRSQNQIHWRTKLNRLAKCIK